jgi:hypothetical protein
MAKVSKAAPVGGPREEVLEALKKGNGRAKKNGDAPVLNPRSSKAPAKTNDEYMELLRCMGIGELQIRLPAEHWVEIEMIGDTPLLTNRFREASLAAMEEKHKASDSKSTKNKAPRDVDREFRESTHICLGDYRKESLETNLYGFPAVGLKKAIATAAYRFGDAKNKVDTASVLFVHGQYAGLMPILPPSEELKKPKKKDRFEAVVPTMRRDPVVSAASGSATISYRAMFYPWRMVVQIGYAPSIISLENLITAVALSGRYVGLGSWRVEKNGDKGKFHIGSITQLPTDFKPVQEVNPQ